MSQGENNQVCIPGREIIACIMACINSIRIYCERVSREQSRSTLTTPQLLFRKEMRARGELRRAHHKWDLVQCEKDQRPRGGRRHRQGCPDWILAVEVVNRIEDMCTYDMRKYSAPREHLAHDMAAVALAAAISCGHE